MKAKEIGPKAQHVLKKTGEGLLDTALPAGIATSGVMTGIELAQQDYRGAAVHSAITVGFIVCDKLSDKARQINAAQAFDAGFRFGQIQGINMQRMEGSVVFRVPYERSDEPVYSSLNGEEVINTPLELMADLGTPDALTTRIGIILGHAEKRPLTQSEVETLRKAEAALELAPEFEHIICSDGQEIVRELRSLTTRYEKEYRKNQESSQS
jgi:hypothetical protein